MTLVILVSGPGHDTTRPVLLQGGETGVSFMSVTKHLSVLGKRTGPDGFHVALMLASETSTRTGRQDHRTHDNSFGGSFIHPNLDLTCAEFNLRVGECRGLSLWDAIVFLLFYPRKFVVPPWGAFAHRDANQCDQSCRSGECHRDRQTTRRRLLLLLQNDPTSTHENKQHTTSNNQRWNWAHRRADDTCEKGGQPARRADRGRPMGDGRRVSSTLLRRHASERRAEVGGATHAARGTSFGSLAELSNDFGERRGTPSSEPWSHRLRGCTSSVAGAQRRDYLKRILSTRTSLSLPSVSSRTLTRVVDM
jgi:hypothetical protein